MPVISSAAPWSYAKAFILVVLFACSTMGMVAAESMPEDVIRNSRALSTLSAAHASASVKRYLRSNAAIITSDLAVNSEERVTVTPPAGFGATVKGHLSEFFEKILRWWWRQIGSTSDSIYKYLKLDKIEEDKLLGSKEFAKWSKFVLSTSKKNPADAEKLMVDTLVRQFGEDGLARLVLAGTKNKETKLYAKALQNAQVARWVDNPEKYTPISVFETLKLHETGTQLFENPGVFSWAAYLREINANKANMEEAAMKSMDEILVAHYNGDLVLSKVLAAGANTEDTKLIAQKLQDAQIARWALEKETPESVYKVLMSDEKLASPFHSSMFTSWSTFVKQFVKKSDESADSNQVIVDMLGGDGKAASMIDKAIEDDVSQTVAKELQKFQFLKWSEKQPEEVEKLLKDAGVTDAAIKRIVHGFEKVLKPSPAAV